MLHVDVTIVSTSFAFLTDPLFTSFNQLIFRKQMKKIKSYLTPLLTSTSFYLNSSWTEKGKRNTCTVCQCMEFSASKSINTSPKRSPFWFVLNVMHWSWMVQDNFWSKIANLSACLWLTKFEVHIISYRTRFLLNKFISDLWPKWKILEIVNDKLIYSMNCHH